MTPFFSFSDNDLSRRLYYALNFTSIWVLTNINCFDTIREKILL